MLALSLSDKFCYFGIFVFVFVFDFFVFVFNRFLFFRFCFVFVFIIFSFSFSFSLTKITLKQWRKSVMTAVYHHQIWKGFELTENDRDVLASCDNALANESRRSSLVCTVALWSTGARPV